MIRLSMMRGDAKFIRLVVTDEDGYPIDFDDIDGVTFTARHGYDNASNVIIKTLLDGDIVVVEAGTIDVPIAADDTSGLAHTTRMVWDVQATFDDLVQTIARGYLWVYPDVTT